MKEYISFFIALALCMALLPATAMAGSTEIVPCKYDYVGNFYEGLAMVRLNGKSGFIDKTGKEVIPCKYNSASDFSDGLAPVSNGDKWGYINKDGKEVIPYKYDYADCFFEGLAAVGVASTDGSGMTMHGYIDTTGKEVIPLKYVQAFAFSEGLANVVNKDFEHGFIDKAGKEIVPCGKYYLGGGEAFLSFFSEGLAAVCDKNSLKWGFIDTTGKEVIPCQYDSVGENIGGFSDGLAVVSNGEYPNEQFCVIDKTGKTVILSESFIKWGKFSDGLLAVLAGQYPNIKWGYIDTTGKQVIPCQYTYSHYDDSDTSSFYGVPFSEGYAVIEENDKCGYIDKTGKVVVTPQYEYARDVHEGLAAVYNNGKYGFISIDGSGAAPSKPAEPTVGDFNDVLASAYYADAVKWDVDKGVTNGTSETTFSPDEVCTRAQAMTCLWRANGSPEPVTASNPFTDIAESDYYYKPVLWAVENGITNGVSDTAFGPDAKCTRAQYMTFLYRAVGGQGSGSAASFSDVAADAYYADAVSWAVNNSVTNGTSNTTFSPDSPCVRAGMVTFLYRVFAK